jgi:hypothetical protein
VIHCILTKSKRNVQVNAEEENVLSLTNKMRVNKFSFFLRICVQYISLAHCLDISQAIRFQLLQFIQSKDDRLKKLGCLGKKRFPRKNDIL